MGSGSSYFRSESRSSQNSVQRVGGQNSTSVSAERQQAPTPEVEANREVTPSRKAVLRHEVFEKVDLDGFTDRSFDDKDDSQRITTTTQAFLQKSLAGFYDIHSAGRSSKATNLANIIESMVKEEFEPGEYVIVEDERGDKLYVVEHGELEVTIKGSVIRTVSTGSVIGELALLYNEPRSATVKCMSHAVLWSLRREVFKRIQSMAASDAQLLWSKWLINSPELAVLPPLDLSRLVGVLRVQTFHDGDLIYSEKQLTNRCILIESGCAEVYMTKVDRFSTKDEALELVGISYPRPKRVKPSGPKGEDEETTSVSGSVEESSGGVRPPPVAATATATASLNQQTLSSSALRANPPAVTTKRSVRFADQIYAETAPDTVVNTERSIVEEQPRKSSPPNAEEKEGISSKTSSEWNSVHESQPSEFGTMLCRIYQGCFIGTRILRGKACMNDSWTWVEHDDLLRIGKNIAEGAECPCTVVAKGTVSCLVFTAERFENLFGPLPTAMQRSTIGMRRSYSVDHHHMAKTLKKFSEEEFHLLSIAGKGNFGTVYIAEYRSGSSSPHSARASKMYANSSPSSKYHSNAVGDAKSTPGSTDTQPVDDNNKSGVCPAVGESSENGLSLVDPSTALFEAGADDSDPGLTANMKVSLKTMNKWNVIDLGFLRHVIDEKNILASLSSMFILKLYGTYQTPEDIVMVTEVLSGGDMWRVIYETPQYSQPPAANSAVKAKDSVPSGLPLSLTRFYTASLVLALAHVHEKGAAYRDIKPENIMLDEKGYLRLIDFGFCKHVPFTKVNPVGETRVCAKTYTLCGTPGLASSLFACYE